MKKLFSMGAAIALLTFASCSEGTMTQKSYNEGINIIPTPVSLVQNNGSYKLAKNTSIYASTEDAKTVANYFASKINRSTGYALSVSDKEASKGISLIIDGSVDVNNEGYLMDVTPANVVIKAKTAQGLFYGMQSFMQLLPAEIESATVVRGMDWSAPCVSIKDEPRFPYRGLHLDPCRHFQTVEEVKRQLDVLALFKINIMHWHLTDDQGWRIEIKKYPKLTEVGGTRVEGEGFSHSGFYTQEEIKEVVKYAADRFIEVIPEIEVPGHEMAAIAAYPELSCRGEQGTPRIIWGVEDIVVCAGKEEVFEFFEDVIAEVVPLFPSQYFHIGGDECPKDSWKACPRCQERIRKEGLKGDKEHTAEERLQSYFVQRIEKVVNSHGKKMIGWDEILEGGLAPTATVMSWRGEAGGIAAANMGHDVIMTPAGNGMYVDHYQSDPKLEPVTIGGLNTLEKIYQYNPTPTELIETGKDHHVLGVQANSWSEYMYTNDIREYRINPRILAIAEIGWSPVDRKDYKDFERRLDNALVRLDAYGINYHIPNPEQPNGSLNFVAFTDKATLEFTSVRPIKMVYTLDGSEPVPSSTIYETPIEFTESGVLKIRSVLPSGKMSPTRTITVEKQALAPAKEVSNKKPGLKMQMTNGMFLNVDGLAAVTDWKESTIKELKEITSQVKYDEGMRGVQQYAAIASGYVEIPEDGVYVVSSDLEEVWIDGQLVVNNRDEVKRFSRNDKSVALAKGLHEIKVVFLGHIIGGWPSMWNDGSVELRNMNADKFSKIKGDMLFH
ncbi:MAG: family 20 glycosylhydrolase [Tannerellaceae bacterium]|nr:family 20 glycosylhydrolase [Tannerellaceae bacterium]